MTDDEILQALDCEYPLPRDALRAATANRATLAPRLIAEIDRYNAAPANEAHRPQRLFFAFHLMGEWRETAAYRPLCRLVRLAPEDFSRVLEGAVTETLHQVLASVFDGDPQPLYDLVHDENADEFARSAACETLAMLSARGDLPLAEVERFLREAFDTLRPRDINYVWNGWQYSIAMLGLESLRPLVIRAFDSFIDPGWQGLEHFEGDLRKAIADGSAALKGGDPRYTLFGDTVAELGTWHGFSEESRRSAPGEHMVEALAQQMLARSEGTYVGTPHTNPYRDVGRNDPCPCGSGEKFKRCHGKS